MYGKKMKKTIKNIAMAGMVALSGLFVACDKVSPTGVFIGGTGVDDRVEMSYTYYKKYMEDSIHMTAPEGEYSFLVGSDSHVATDTGRMAEMFNIGLEHGDLLYAHLGDIADTKAEYYITLSNAVNAWKQKYFNKYFELGHEAVGDNADSVYYWYDKRYDHGYKEIEKGNTEAAENFYTSIDNINFPFYPVVGNHDITHNGWALFTSLFHSSFYEFDVKIKGTDQYDHFIFLDSANGTLGQKQINLIEDGMLNSDKNIRHTFVFTHTNLFRPSSVQFSSTFPREELYFLLNKLSQWNTTIMFCGHVHKWDDRTMGGVRYLTLESMSERNSPEPGDYLVRVTCRKDGSVDVERVHMNYVAKKK